MLSNSSNDMKRPLVNTVQKENSNKIHTYWWHLISFRIAYDSFYCIPDLVLNFSDGISRLYFYRSTVASTIRVIVGRILKLRMILSASG